MIKLGIVSSAYLDRYGMHEGLHRMREHGYEATDLQQFVDTETPFYTMSPAKLERELAPLRSACADADIRIAQLHGPWRYPPRDAAASDRAERLDKMKRSVYISSVLGCPYMVIHPIMPFGGESEPDAKRMWDLNYEFMRKLADAGQALGVTVCFENMPFPALSISSPEAVLQFVKTLDHPFFKICLDTGHCSVLGISAGESVRRIGKEYLSTLHIHDNDGSADRHALPFTGVTDWEDFSSALAEIGFDGVASLETQIDRTVPNGPLCTEKEKALLASLKRIARRTD